MIAGRDLPTVFSDTWTRCPNCSGLRTEAATTILWPGASVHSISLLGVGLRPSWIPTRVIISPNFIADSNGPNGLFISSAIAEKKAQDAILLEPNPAAVCK